MANTESLTPFTKNDNRASEAGKKGKRGPSLITALKQIFEEAREKDTDLSPKKFMTEIALKCKNKGDAALLRLILEYLEGKVKDKVEHSGPDGQPIQTKIEIEFTNNPDKSPVPPED
jgi:hypothetical protein